MSIQTQIARLTKSKQSLLNWLNSNGYNMASTSKMDALCDEISKINIQKFYVGNSEPQDSVGNDGDLYFVTE